MFLVVGPAEMRDFFLDLFHAKTRCFVPRRSKDGLLRTSQAVEVRHARRGFSQRRGDATLELDFCFLFIE